MMQKTKIKGAVAVFLSALVLYLATVVVRNGIALGLANVSQYVFARFLLGSLAIGALCLMKKKEIKVVKVRYLVGRAVMNFVALSAFYMAVKETSTVEANILNMTYPIFISLIVWIAGIGKRDLLGYLVSLIAFIGIALTLGIGTDSTVGLNSLWGLSSGIFAAFAIIFLTLARKDNDTDIVLLYMFVIGLVLSAIFFSESLSWPTGLEFSYLLLSATFGLLGQFLLTYGIHFLTAVEGGVIGTSRILIAALLGPIIASDPAIGLLGWVGALLILFSNVFFVVRKPLS